MSKVREIALGERDAIAAYLRRQAKAHVERANAVPPQGKLVLDVQVIERQMWTATAGVLDAAAKAIMEEAHWK